ncbi:hypothetical protein H5410_015758, partial [Solanum commersonii]
MANQTFIPSTSKFTNPFSLDTDSVLDYDKFLKPQILNEKITSPISLPTIPYEPNMLLHGEPYTKWTEKGVKSMGIIESLQHAIIGFFRNRHILIRLSLKEDFINITSKLDVWNYIIFSVAFRTYVVK